MLVLREEDDAETVQCQEMLGLEKKSHEVLEQRNYNAHRNWPPQRMYCPKDAWLKQQPFLMGSFHWPLLVRRHRGASLLFNLLDEGSNLGGYRVVGMVVSDKNRKIGE